MKYYDNRTFALCASYPPLVAVPKKALDSMVQQSSKFRTSERLGALAYGYRVNGKVTYLWRCSQCKVLFIAAGADAAPLLRRRGVFKTAGRPDGHLEFLLCAGRDAQNLYIYDARPYLNAVTNKLAGKGFENTAFYTNSQLKFLNIQNIHHMRKSFQKLFEICQASCLF